MNGPHQDPDTTRPRGLTREAIDVRFKRDLVWMTVRHPQVTASRLTSSVQTVSRLRPGVRLLIDARPVDGARPRSFRPGPRAWSEQVAVPVGVRVAILLNRRDLDLPVHARTRTGSLASVAAFTRLRDALRWLRAGDRRLAPAMAAPLELGAIKDLLYRFAQARRNAPREQLRSELGELYRILCAQGQQLDLDPERAMALYRAQTAKRRPRLVHTMRGTKRGTRL
jgi:hypothetical protein